MANLLKKVVWPLVFITAISFFSGKCNTFQKDSSVKPLTKEELWSKPWVKPLTKKQFEKNLKKLRNFDHFNEDDPYNLYNSLAYSGAAFWNDKKARMIYKAEFYVPFFDGKVRFIARRRLTDKKPYIIFADFNGNGEPDKNEVLFPKKTFYNKTIYCIHCPEAINFEPHFPPSDNEKKDLFFKYKK